MKQSSAFAPASIGNVAVGFDLLGLSFPLRGDIVRINQTSHQGRVTIKKITGPIPNLPYNPEENTAGKAVLSLMRAVSPPFGCELIIEKGIPLGSGMGGSAASAVAGVLAVNGLLKTPLPIEELIPFALEGEALSSGSYHPDNVLPSLLGGLILALGEGGKSFRRIPLPKGIGLCLVHPDIIVKTKEARALLKPEISKTSWIEQTRHFGGFLTGCFTKDKSLIGAHLKDVIIEPQRKILIPHFDEMKTMAEKGGCLGFSLSGSGPSLFALCPTVTLAKKFSRELVEFLKNKKISAQGWGTSISQKGGYLIP